jgi:MFS family permease
MRLFLYCLAGLVFDWLLYVVWTMVPLRADELHASSFQLGLLQACSSVVYVTMCILLGRLADRVPRPLFARIGCLLMIGSCLLLPFARTVGALIAMMPLLGLSGAFFWPSIQAAIGAEAPAHRLERDIGLFNVLWSVGKSLGYLSAGAMKGLHVSMSVSLLIAAAGAALVFCFYPFRDGPRAAAAARPDDHADPARRLAFLRMSWIANFAVFGVGATLGSQFIKWIKSGVRLDGLDPALFFGLFLGLIFVFQTAAFIVLRMTRAWTYRAAPLFVSQILLATVCLAIGSSSPWLILACAPAIGAGLGVGYASSIYYSLHTPAGHGRLSGLHEAILGAGNFLVPLAGGAIAKFDLRLPYDLCAILCLAAVAAEIYVLRAAATTPSKVPTT